MAVYVVTKAVTRPTIVFDQGFLDDGNHNLDLSKMTSPTASDYAALVKWEVKLRGAQALRPDLVDATNAYEHFLSATGTEWHFNYEKFVSDDDSGKQIVGQIIADIVQWASWLCTSRGNTASTKSDSFMIQTPKAIKVEEKKGATRTP